MPFHVFQYALPGVVDLDDLNAFLAGHRVLTVEHHFLAHAAGTTLVFLVQTAEATEQRSTRKAEAKVDYRAVLPPEQFSLFSQLRDLRRSLAEADGVPVYTVFTNAQLAEIVQRRPASAADLLAIEGIGQARVERYGQRVLALLGAAS